jgi:hypothetical protein
VSICKLIGKPQEQESPQHSAVAITETKGAAHRSAFEFLDQRLSA